MGSRCRESFVQDRTAMRSEEFIGCVRAHAGHSRTSLSRRFGTQNIGAELSIQHHVAASRTPSPASALLIGSAQFARHIKAWDSRFEFFIPLAPRKGSRGNAGTIRKADVRFDTLFHRRKRGYFEQNVHLVTQGLEIAQFKFSSFYEVRISTCNPSRRLVSSAVRDRSVTPRKECCFV